MTGPEILAKMSEGFTLHSCRFGWFMMNPIDAYTFNIHNGAAKSLVRSGRIQRCKGGGHDWDWIPYVPKEGDKVEACRRIGRDLADKGERMTIVGILDGERFQVKPEVEKCGFIAKASEIRFLTNSREHPPR